MPRQHASALVEYLVQQGIATRRALRAVAELEDHYEDLEAEARGIGMSCEEAAAEARSRLGDIRTIATLFSSRPELTSGLRRWTRSWVPLPLAAVDGGVLVAAPNTGIIARWCVSVCCGALLTSTLLFVLQLVVL